ncbi:Hypothetical protein POVN_LOCUS626 [uncultured virus]|nr:Hypothetical protein POVN_LOCUS626 [uncultured virus]
MFTVKAIQLVGLAQVCFLTGLFFDERGVWLLAVTLCVLGVIYCLFKDSDTLWRVLIVLSHYVMGMAVYEHHTVWKNVVFHPITLSPCSFCIGFLIFFYSKAEGITLLAALAVQFYIPPPFRPVRYFVLCYMLALLTCGYKNTYKALRVGLLTLPLGVWFGYQMLS